MDPALNIFLNGILGVSAGMFVLYLTIKLISVLGREPTEEKKEQ